MPQLRIPAVVMRGGTSKGVFFRSEALPVEPELRDRVMLRAFGSPDPYRRQIDGLGGGASTTSKAAIISRSSRPDCDVEYLFAQVALDRSLVDYSANCGNISAAVGPFAIEEGLVAATGERTTVRIWQVNTAKRIVAHCPTRDGEPDPDGEYLLDGVPNPGAEIALEFLDPGGSRCASLFPTGRQVDRLEVPGVGEVVATLVDAGNPTVLIHASAVGLTGTELPPEVDGNASLLDRLERIRCAGAVAMALGTDAATITREQPANPKLAFVAPPTDYRTVQGLSVTGEAMDLTARMMSMGRLHPAFAVTGGVAVAIGTAVPGTVANQMARSRHSGISMVCLGHPSGTIAVGVEVAEEDGAWRARKAILGRTARRLMEGYVRIPAAAIPGWRPAGSW